MPTYDRGTEETSSRIGLKGEYEVRFLEVAEKVMRARSEDSSFPDSLRVVMEVSEDKDKTVSLSVPIDAPADALLGFVPDPDAAPVGDEDALRQFIEENIEQDPIYVYVRDDFVRSRLALEGVHVFTRLVGIWPYTTDSGRRIGMTAATADGLTTTFNCKDPGLECREGKDGPEGDYLGPKQALNPNQYVFEYLCNFGLNWEKLDEELKAAEAYWPGHLSLDRGEIPALFPSIENPWPGFLEMIERHGPQAVKMEITRHKTYGLGPKRVGDFPKVWMKSIEFAEDPAAARRAAEFVKELAVMDELWGNLATVYFNKDAALVTPAGSLTDEGRDLAKRIIVPVVGAYPDVVKGRKPDGGPAITFPVTPDGWNLDGLVCMCWLAERLLADHADGKIDVLEPNGIADGDTEALLAWAAERVPELAGNLAGKEETL